MRKLVFNKTLKNFKDASDKHLNELFVEAVKGTKKSE
jgi:hypothetical protein